MRRLYFNPNSKPSRLCNFSSPADTWPPRECSGCKSSTTAMSWPVKNTHQRKENQLNRSTENHFKRSENLLATPFRAHKARSHRIVFSRKTGRSTTVEALDMATSKQSTRMLDRNRSVSPFPPRIRSSAILNLRALPDRRFDFSFVCFCGKKVQGGF